MAAITDSSALESFTDQHDSSNSTKDPPLDEQATQEPKLRLLYSEVVGPPSFVLDPEHLATCHNLCPDKMGPRIVLLDAKTVVKYGRDVRMAEAEALHLVNTKTSIRAPLLELAYVLDGIGVLVMSYEEGESLTTVWATASSEQREQLIKQLSDAVSQLRQFKGTFIGGLDGSSCIDGVFLADWGSNEFVYGPYDSESDFNEGIIEALENRSPPDKRPKDPESAAFNREYLLRQTVRALKGHEIVFTHADLHGGNILVQNGNIVILDWGLAGYWPDYWEYYRAMFHPPAKSSWEREIEKFVPPYYIECMVMQKVFATLWR